MRRSFLNFVLVLALLLSLVACGKSDEGSIVGFWQLVDQTSSTEFGVGLEFKEDGTLVYGLTEDVITNIENFTDVDMDEAFSSLDMSQFMSMTYEVVSSSKLEVEYTVMFGFASGKKTIKYKLDGDTLKLDGVEYKRVK